MARMNKFTVLGASVGGPEEHSDACSGEPPYGSVSTCERTSALIAAFTFAGKFGHTATISTIREAVERRQAASIAGFQVSTEVSTALSMSRKLFSQLDLRFPGNGLRIGVSAVQDVNGEDHAFSGQPNCHAAHLIHAITPLRREVWQP